MRNGLTRIGLWTLPALLAASVCWAQSSLVRVPADTIVRVELTEDINSGSSRRGDNVSARLDEEDRSGFPDGTRFEGVLTEVRRATDDRPAVLGMEFRRAILPDGSQERLRGTLASLSDDRVRTAEDGRLESRRGGGSFDWKWVGIGAGGGGVLAEVFGDGFFKGALLGGLGGAIYSYLNREKDGDYKELKLDRGTEFGIRLTRGVSFSRQAVYRFASAAPGSGVATPAAQTDYRYDTSTVRLDGRDVRFEDAKPMRIDGTLFVPLAPVAKEAGWDFKQSADTFSHQTPSGLVSGKAGEDTLTRNGSNYVVRTAPSRINGEIYVPIEYLGRIGGLSANWDGRGRRLDLRSDRSGTARATPVAGQERNALEKFEPSVLVQALSAIDYSEVKSRLSSYRIVDLQERLNEEQIASLRTVLNENAVARRNRSLLTNLLRDANLISRLEEVVGAAGSAPVLYIADTVTR